MEIVSPKSEQEFERYYQFRWEQLREPWGQPKGSERDEQEDESFHVSVVDESGSIVGVGRIHFNSGEEAQVRYMAAHPECQGKGVGRKVMNALEEHALAKGAKKVILNARENAVGFYERLGYVVSGDGHTAFGVIKHFVMDKHLE